MTQTTAINSLKSGINRLRTKGGASADGLYDLLNGYITLSGSIVSRQGTVEDATLPAGTHGLCAFDGALVVFAITPKTCPTGYSCEVLFNPNDPSLDIAEIHESDPMMGFLYVVAEFTDGSVFHYWLEGSGAADSTWQADTIYNVNDIVLHDGIAYKATRLTPAAPVWVAGEARAVNDVREPTVYNGYQYTVTATSGTNPHSGDIEPAWKAEEGATVYEEVDVTPTDAPDTDDPTAPDTTLPTDTRDRYGGIGRTVLP